MWLLNSLAISQESLAVIAGTKLVSWYIITWTSHCASLIWGSVAAYFFCQCTISSELQLLNTLRPRQNGRHFPDDIFKWIFVNENAWISINIHWSLFLGVQLTIFQHWFRWWLGAGQATRHYLNQCWLVYWRIYASLGLNELTRLPPSAA